MSFPSFLVLCFVLLSSISITEAAETLRINQTLKDGQNLVSSNERFELGFFSPESSNSNRYLGIWYKNIPLTVVWIANRNKPIVGLSGILGLDSNGLSISSNSSAIFWSSNSTKTLTNPILQLLDNGNLVLIAENGRDSEGYVWQSFDYITNNLLPDMKLGWNIKTGFHRKMTSWLNADNPSNGDFSFTLDSPETPQLVLSKGTEKQYRWGPWDGVRFSGSSELKSNAVFIPVFYSSNEEVYYTYKVVDNSSLLRSEVTDQGLINYLRWSTDSNRWVTMVTLQRDACDRYEVCGPYASCYSGPSCKCLKGFSPKSPEDWERFDYTGGCVRKWNLDCRNEGGFVKYTALKLPDNSHLIGNRSTSLEDCEAVCLKNCSCTAYTRFDIHGDGGDCLLWYGNLVDLRYFPNTYEELYIRMAKAELEFIADAKRKKKVKSVVAIVVPVVSGIILFGIFGWYVLRKRKVKRKGSKSNPYEERKQETSDQEDLELPLFSLSIISVATNEFSFLNKIGEGGFGPVYKGVLPSGQEIAVKRLSKQSGQGLKEFKNEVILIAKLQHRNLVKLLGCCIQSEERMLVYEYLPNKSLDCFLFDKAKKEILTWEKRMNIIVGIARGLLYLHQDSRLRIIHRDLKASNILLDIEMIPKISDFGTARMFVEEQTQEMTNRIIGTYGYMSPEYAMSGHFSVKSDVFSFGVLVLEVLSGKKNWGFYHPDHGLNLLGHAWKLWNEGRPLELIDAVMEKAFSEDEASRCIEVGLLCVQQRVEDRPTMASVLLMLGNENSRVPEPKEPGFYTEAYSSSGTDTSSTRKNPHTANKVTITILGGR